MKKAPANWVEKRAKSNEIQVGFKSKHDFVQNSQNSSVMEFQSAIGMPSSSTWNAKFFLLIKSAQNNQSSFSQLSATK